jgi:hypothetical protein
MITTHNMAHEYNKRYAIKIMRNVRQCFTSVVRKWRVNSQGLANTLVWNVTQFFSPSCLYYSMSLLLALVLTNGEHKPHLAG